MGGPDRYIIKLATVFQTGAGQNVLTYQIEYDKSDPEHLPTRARQLVPLLGRQTLYCLSGLNADAMLVRKRSNLLFPLLDAPT